MDENSMTFSKATKFPLVETIMGLNGKLTQWKCHVCNVMEKETISF
jgi:hypothetical protein